MKNSVIIAIFDSLMADKHVPKNEERQYKIQKAYDELKETLGPDLFKLYCKYESELMLEKSDDIEFFFIEGFKLGIRILIECIED